LKINISDLRKVKGIGSKTIDRIIEQFDESEYISKYNPNLKLEENSINCGDCLDLMNGIEDNSVSLILADLPFNKTKNKWDSAIDLDKLWKQYKRVLKNNGVIVLHAEKPFDVALINSNPEWFKYEWIWEKESGVGHLNANYAPMKNHESVLVFSKASACYVKDKSNAMPYNPQMRNGKPYKITKGSLSSNYDMKHDKIVTTENNGERYPLTILKYNRPHKTIHPTQKPVKLEEYFIKTYTDENELVVDNASGSGTTGIACINTNRKYKCIEKDKEYYETSVKRVKECNNG
jgi:site-specific DNA-methyltransferase (adenine-specific)